MDGEGRYGWAGEGGDTGAGPGHSAAPYAGTQTGRKIDGKMAGPVLNPSSVP